MTVETSEYGKVLNMSKNYSSFHYLNIITANIFVDFLPVMFSPRCVFAFVVGSFVWLLAKRRFHGL